MTFNIETRFDIGDIVYVADHYDCFYPSKDPYVVNDIIVNINDKSLRVMYNLIQNGRSYKFPDQWMFHTYEECTKWCDKINKGL